MNGIYGYYDNEKNYVAYIGRDSDIDINRRHNEHCRISKRDDQRINKVLQNNPDRYDYFVLVEGEFSDKELNDMESKAIQLFGTYKQDYPQKSVFNFTKGGEGTLGYVHSEDAKEKMSKAKKGKTTWTKGVKKSNEWINKISESLKGHKRSEESKKKQSQSLKGKYCKSNHSQWKDYARIIKRGRSENNKVIYSIRFEGKNIKSSVYQDKLVNWFKDNYPNEELVIYEG